MKTDRERLQAMAADLEHLAPPPGPTREDRRGRVSEALRRHPEASDRHVAARLKVSREMVAAARGRLLAAGQLAPSPVRFGLDGKAYKARHEAARRPAPDPRAVLVRDCLRAAYALSGGARLPETVLDWITRPPAATTEGGAA